jgi:hypothetical protein
MKKFLSVLLLAVVGMTAGSAYANGVFAKNDLLGSITLGFGNGFGQRVAIDYGVADGWLDGKASLGVGASVNNTIGWNFNYDAISVVANCSFHYQFVDKLDTYVVAGFGGGIAMAENHFGGGIDWTSAVGLRYYFSNTTAFNFEAGHTAGCFVNLGLTFRL